MEKTKSSLTVTNWERARFYDLLWLFPLTFLFHIYEESHGFYNWVTVTLAGWEGQRLIAGIKNSKDIYFDSISQVKAPRWSNGRLAMVGDAAYCVLRPLPGWARRWPLQALISWPVNCSDSKTILRPLRPMSIGVRKIIPGGF